MSDAGDTFALAYRYCDEGKVRWFFLLTVPEGRKWRGPYVSREAMEVAARAELGPDVTIIKTKVRPGQLTARGGADAARA